MFSPKKQGLEVRVQQFTCVVVQQGVVAEICLRISANIRKLSDSAEFLRQREHAREMEHCATKENVVFGYFSAEHETVTSPACESRSYTAATLSQVALHWATKATMPAH